MTFIKGIIIFCFLLLGNMAFGQVNNTFVLKVAIDSIPNAVYYVCYDNGGLSVKDSVVLDGNKSFVYQGSINEPALVYIRTKNIYNKRLVGDFGVNQFWVEPGKETNIRIDSGWKIFGAIGWEANYRSMHFIKQTGTDSLYRKWDYIVDEKIVDWKAKHEGKINGDQYGVLVRKSMSSFLADQPATYFSLWLIERLSRYEDADLVHLDKQLDTFPAELQSTFLASDIRKKIRTKISLVVGKPMPDFSLPDTSSTIVAFADFKGKYVLLDFWASWCGPCKKEIPLLKQLYGKFKDKGFDIVGISLDDERSMWIDAIVAEELRWRQLSDLTGFRGKLSKQFDVTGIPDNFLVDPNGIIIARNLHSERLATFLEKIFSADK